MSANKKIFFVVYLIFVFIMFLIYKLVPLKYGFIAIVLFPLLYWLIYELILKNKNINT